VAEGTPEELKQRVGGDVIVIEADRPEELIPALREKLGVEAALVGDKLHVARPRGHELVPRLVEAFPDGRLRSVGLHPPNLADAFVKLTGSAL
jgi:ABC-2 type transport system ATP-binding protein